MVRAVFWDFGGVVLASPFDAFNEYEEARGIPAERIEALVVTNTEPKDFGFAGEARVNVLRLNLALDAAFAQVSG